MIIAVCAVRFYISTVAGRIILRFAQRLYEQGQIGHVQRVSGTNRGRHLITF